MTDILPHPRHSLLVWAVQLVSLASIAAFLVAVVVNSMVFDRWGLEFLQIATPSDVLMSGLAILFSWLRLMAFFCVGFVIALLPFNERRTDILICSALAAFIEGCLVFIVHIFGQAFDHYFELSSWIYITSILGTIVAIGFLQAVSLKRSDFVGGVVLGSIVLLGIWIHGVGLINHLSKVGFSGVNAYPREICGELIGETEDAQLLWAGQNASAIRCGGTGPIYVKYNSLDSAVKYTGVPRDDDLMRVVEVIEQNGRASTNTYYASYLGTERQVMSNRELAAAAKAKVVANGKLSAEAAESARYNVFVRN